MRMHPRREVSRSPACCHAHTVCIKLLTNEVVAAGGRLAVFLNNEARCLDVVPSSTKSKRAPDAVVHKLLRSNRGPASTQSIPAAPTAICVGPREEPVCQQLRHGGPLAGPPHQASSHKVLGIVGQS